jgi:DNA-binding NarL/FixJ family response regulator
MAWKPLAVDTTRTYQRPANKPKLRGKSLCLHCLTIPCLHDIKPTRLTQREISIVILIAQGLANKEIGYKIGLAEGSVKHSISSAIFPKLKLDNRVKVALWAQEHAAVLTQASTS